MSSSEEEEVMDVEETTEDLSTLLKDDPTSKQVSNETTKHLLP